MTCRKAVTKEKLDANRKNARRSTGPRTERGKRNTRFNAVTLGLFAKHVVIPICDGHKAEKDFQLLIDEIYQEFQPVGVYEEWLVVRIAECMWRLRRAARCESGSVRESAIWDDRSALADAVDDKRSERWLKEIWVLNEAEQQLRDAGTLSREVYARVAPLVEEERRQQIQSEEKGTWVDAEFDRAEFLTCIAQRKAFLDPMFTALTQTQGDRFAAKLDRNLLLPEEDMDRVLRYEERMYRQIDWAVQRLLECQERRRTCAPPTNVVRRAAGQNTKRSQFSAPLLARQVFGS
jgi:hypothetical protein